MKNKAAFLDRDGVINKKREDYVKSLDEFEILDGVAESIKILKDNGFLVIVITNQSAIDRKLLSIKSLDAIHYELKKYLKKNNTYLDSIYFCPHKPDANCDCRKPKPGLIIKASQEFDVDLKKSFFVGDSLSDLDAANNAGCEGILLEKHQSLLELIKKIL